MCISLGCRLMAGQRILVPSMGVRLPPSQPRCVVTLSPTARSSSGSGRRPLKAEITGSNPVRATKSFRGTPSPSHIRPVRLAVQDAALSRRRSPVRIRYGLPTVQGLRKESFSCLNCIFFLLRAFRRAVSGVSGQCGRVYGRFSPIAATRGQTGRLCAPSLLRAGVVDELYAFRSNASC